MAKRFVKAKDQWKPAQRIPRAEIDAGKTPAGGWTRATLAQWGVPWPPPQGWYRSLMEPEFHNCECGAVYLMGTMKLSASDHDHENCAVCGRLMATWAGSRIPTFKLVKRPTSAPPAS